MCYLISLVVFASIVATNAAPNLGIIGGEPTNIEDFPYIVQLRNEFEFLCGGSILDEKTILTAAHCVLSEPVEGLYIQYGNKNISLGEKIQAAKIIMHEKFVYQPPWTYDIALIMLSEPIQFGDTAKAVELPKADEDTPVNKTAVLAGWGVIEAAHVTYPKTLYSANLTVFSDKECFDSYHVLGYGDVDTKTELCAGKRGGGKGQCHGDSGGPLIIDGVQYGIVSFSKGCAEENFPGVLTKVSGYIDWINKNR